MCLDEVSKEVKVRMEHEVKVVAGEGLNDPLEILLDLLGQHGLTDLGRKSIQSMQGHYLVSLWEVKTLHQILQHSLEKGILGGLSLRSQQLVQVERNEEADP